MKQTEEFLNAKVTVCDKCLKASCWQYVFVCDEAKNAGTTKKTRRELIELKLEHTDHMLTDDQIMRQ